MNCQGLGDYFKRTDIFNWFRDKKFDISIITDIHVKPTDMTKWKTEWGNEAFFSGSRGDARGIGVLFSNTFSYEIHKKLFDPNGNYLILDMTIDLMRFTLVAIYGPNRDDPNFFSDIQDLIDSLENTSVIITGDFNVVQSYELDTYKYINQNNPHAQKRLHEIMHEIGYIDIWRNLNGLSKQFSWKGPAGKRSRLDYFLISENLESICDNSKILPGYRTDHSLITLELKLSDQKRGRGLWTFNNSLLKDLDYVDIINKTIDETVQQYRTDKNNLDYDSSNVQFDISDQLFFETLKIQIRGASIPYAARKKKMLNERENQLNRKIEEVHNETNRTDETDRREDELKTELQRLREFKTRESILKTKATWMKEGEKCTKYFCNLEKKEYTEKLMYKLKRDDNSEVTNLKDILNEQLKFYKNLYSENKDNSNKNSKNIGKFLDNNNPFIQKISEEEKLICEGALTKQEYAKFLKEMKNGKSPGSDGYTSEFYKFFWKKIGDFLVRSLNEAHRNGELSITQRYGVIICIPKKDKPKMYLKNWRPITLLNVDCKIFSGALANRLKPILKRIIGESQNGYLEGRDISECTRLVTDLIYMSKFKKRPGLLLLLDFQKAFDSLDFNYIHKCLEFYNFGENFRKAVKTLYTNLSSVILYNGHCTESFSVSRGVRQGDPLSPFIFILAVDPMAAALKYNENVKGIYFNEIEYLISQLADDCTLFLDGSSCSLRSTFLLLRDFASCSGLNLNVEKTKAVWIGSYLGRSKRLLPNEPIEWIENGKFNILGIDYDLYSNDIAQSNYSKAFEKIEILLSSWTWRNLTIFGKISVIKSLALPKIVHFFRSLPNPSEEFFNKLEKLFFDFIWDKKPEKIKRTIMFSDLCEGGANMTSIRDFANSLKLFWVKKIIDQNNNNKWKSLFLDQAKKIGGKNVFYYTIETLKNTDLVENPFWRNIIQIWGEIKSIVKDPDDDYLSKPLWFNQNIKVGNETIFYYHWSSKGINFINDLLNENGEFWSIEELTNNFHIKTTFLEYGGLLNSIPADWKKEFRGKGKARHIKCKAIYLIQNLKKPNREIYDRLVKNRQTKPENVIQKWNLELETNNDFSELLKQLLPIRNTNLKNFQFKIFHRVLGTNRYTFKTGITNTDRCTFCFNERETIAHLFWHCTTSKNLWLNIKHDLDIENLFPNLTLNLKTVLFGYIGDDSSSSVGLNTFLILVKKYIFSCKMKEQEPSLAGVKNYTLNYVGLDEYFGTHDDHKWRVVESWR